MISLESECSVPLSLLDLASQRFWARFYPLAPLNPTPPIVSVALRTRPQNLHMVPSVPKLILLYLHYTGAELHPEAQNSKSETPTYGFIIYIVPSSNVVGGLQDTFAPRVGVLHRKLHQRGRSGNHPAQGISTRLISGISYLSNSSVARLKPHPKQDGDNSRIVGCKPGPQILLKTH